MEGKRVDSRDARFWMEEERCLLLFVNFSDYRTALYSFQKTNKLYFIEKKTLYLKTEDYLLEYYDIYLKQRDEVQADNISLTNNSMSMDQMENVDVAKNDDSLKLSPLCSNLEMNKLSRNLRIFLVNLCFTRVRRPIFINFFHVEVVNHIMESIDPFTVFVISAFPIGSPLLKQIKSSNYAKGRNFYSNDKFLENIKIDGNVDANIFWNDIVENFEQYYTTTFDDNFKMKINFSSFIPDIKGYILDFLPLLELLALRSVCRYWNEHVTIGSRSSISMSVY
jgi:hypothetical protein